MAHRTDIKVASLPLLRREGSQMTKKPKSWTHALSKKMTNHSLLISHMYLKIPFKTRVAPNCPCRTTVFRGFRLSVQVQSGGVLEQGAGCGCPSPHRHRDHLHMGALHDPGSAWGRGLRHGHLGLPQRHHTHLHAQPPEWLHEGTGLLLLLCCCCCCCTDAFYLIPFNLGLYSVVEQTVSSLCRTSGEPCWKQNGCLALLRLEENICHRIPRDCTFNSHLHVITSRNQPNKVVPFGRFFLYCCYSQPWATKQSTKPSAVSGCGETASDVSHI